jgi:hypothetical protein
MTVRRSGDRRGNWSAARRATLRRILACALGAAGASTGAAIAPADARRAALPMAVDLAADGAAGGRLRRPILLFYDRDDCAFCERALREYLVPMARDDPWRERAIFRQIEVDRPLPLVGFDGRATTHRAFAAATRVALTPTVVVVDAVGAPLAEAVVGLTTVDFYGAYLEDALDRAWKRLNS